MDYNKVKVWVLISLAVILIISVFVNTSNKLPDSLKLQEGWKYEWVCSRESAYSQQDYEDGYYCLLENCQTKIIKGIEVKSCICAENNKTVNKLCTDKILTVHKDWQTFDKPTNITEEEIQ